MAEFSDYIVYVDESGDLGLRNIDRGFPLFCLAMCVFPIQDYANTTVPAISALKFQHWGHDGVILHENEIRQRKGDFKGIIQNRENELQLIKDIHTIITEANFQIVASVINKAALIKKYSNPWSPYELAVHFCLERLHRLMIGKGQPGKTVHVVFESRGKKEDHELELAFDESLLATTPGGGKSVILAPYRMSQSSFQRKQTSRDFKWPIWSRDRWLSRLCGLNKPIEPMMC